MEYVIILVLQLIGVALHVGQKLNQLDQKFEDDTFREVWNMFWKTDRITVMISGVIVLLHGIAHYIIEDYTKLSIAIPYYHLWDFGIALVLGYAGQRIVYSLLGKAEKRLMEKADKL